MALQLFMSMQCWCNTKIGTSEAQVKSHIKSCNFYLRRSFFYSNVDRIPPQASEGDLRLMVAELRLIEEVLLQRMQAKSGMVPPAPKSPARQAPPPASIPKPSVMDVEEPAYHQVSQIPITDPYIVECLECKKKFYSNFDIQSLFYVEECWHLFCKPCMVKYITKEFVNQNGTLKCLLKGCNVSVHPRAIAELIGKERLSDLQYQVIRKQCNIVSCAKCKAQFELVQGKQQIIKDASNRPLPPLMQKHYAQNRYNCVNCKTQQCKTCKAIPYHIGKSCEEFKSLSLMRKCRYCGDVMQEINSRSGIRALEDICPKKECQEMSKMACSKMLPCGHSCKGFAGEKKCLPCLDEKCATTNAELHGQKGEDFCPICYVEALDAAPCIRSACGHIFHLKCIQKRIEIRWLGPRILFNFCACPLCKRWIQLPEQSALQKKVIENQGLFEKIKSKCVERLKFEGCDKDQKLKDPKSPYFQKPLEYALAIFSYYQCFKCKEPYFGGRKACENAMNDGQADFKPEQLICSGCCEVPIENCPKHGKEYIEFKCKFCCTVAQWFCWGNTHFCESCHQKQCKGEYISKYPKDKLPKCEGPGKCPVGGNHHGNGDQRPLGCAICRNMKEAGKSF